MADEIKNETQNEEKIEQVEESTEEPQEEKSNEEILEEKIKELNDKYMRLYAEYDNYQKRTQKEKEARYSDAVIDTAGQILNIGDDLERALQVEVTSDDAKKFKEGIEMVFKQFTDTLSKLNIKPIVAVGEQFDPNIHNAVMHIEDESIDDNTVVEEFQKGYMYNDSKVVRHSMVKVAN